MDKTDKIKIAIAHPFMNMAAGSEFPALWAIEALKDDYAVTLITADDLDFGVLNECYGTKIGLPEINVIKVEVPLFLKSKFAAVRGALFMKFCRKISDNFDLVISTYNVMTFKNKGIQFIADFSFDDRLRRKFDSRKGGFRPFFYEESFLRNAYLNFVRLIAGDGGQNEWKKNLTIVNSYWVKDILKEEYGKESKVISPPVASMGKLIPWSEREDGFVILARISPEKKIDNAVQAITRLQEKGYNLHLHILGRRDDAAYIKYLKDKFIRNNRNIFIEDIMLGEKKLDFITRHKFGISARENEPFGIAIAEMVKSGCIVWVPDGGGQREIVNHDELMYKSIDDAVEKIESVLKDEVKQNELLLHLSKQAEKFSIERFKEEIRMTVKEFLSSDVNSP